MSETADRREQPGPESRVEWVRPTVSLVGTVALVVRGGSALGKLSGGPDGDPGNSFQCRPEQCPH